jgi:hypothetical protein
VPLVPNPVQAQFLDDMALAWQYDDLKIEGQRRILLKARQFGFSTLIEALLFINTVNTPNTNTVVIAMRGDNTDNLFQMVQCFYDNLPEEKKPAKKYANRKEFLWDAIGSRFYVGTAENADFGRGSTIHNVHMSEVAFWRKADLLIAGLLQAVPASGNIFLETTANGLGNWYYEEWQAAQRGASVFTPHFYGWHLHPDYRAASVPADFVRTEEEIALAEAFGLDDAQLLWRRGKMKELRGKFAQEYPASAEEAFLTSGNPYFDRDFLYALNTRLQSAEYDPLAGVRIPLQFSRLRAAYQAGKLEVWQPPAPGHGYVIAADTAEGLDDKGVHDFDSADVADGRTWAQVAHLHGLWDTNEYGLLLAELGRWYNTALVGVERNNHGHAVLNSLLHNAEYPPMTAGAEGGVYFHEEWDEKGGVMQRKPGWITTTKTKYFALDTLATAVIERDLHLKSRKTVGEMLTFVKLPGGRAGGEGKSHDDAVSSASILAALLKIRPRPGVVEVSKRGRFF